MSSAEAPTAGPRLLRPLAWFDPESAAVATILLGLFQLLLSALLYHADITLPKLFILPLILGVSIIVGGSLTMANERNPSMTMLKQCAGSNVVGLLGAMLGFCLYCYSLSIVPNMPCPGSETRSYSFSWRMQFECPGKILEAYTWSIIMLLLLYNCGAIVLHGFLSLSAVKTLKATWNL